MLYILFYARVHPSFDGWLKFLDYPYANPPQTADEPLADGPFTLRFQISMRTQPSKAISDLKEALNTRGALVVYMGHTALDKKGAIGLQPQLKKKTILKNQELVKLLEKASANVVVLAGCSTKASVPKQLKNDIVTITTDSGSNLVTHSLDFARAIAAFLFALIGYTFDPNTSAVTQRNTIAKINEAIADANAFLRNGDQFVLASGNGNMTLP